MNTMKFKYMTVALVAMMTTGAVFASGQEKKGFDYLTGKSNLEGYSSQKTVLGQNSSTTFSYNNCTPLKFLPGPFTSDWAQFLPPTGLIQTSYFQNSQNFNEYQLQNRVKELEFLVLQMLYNGTSADNQKLKDEIEGTFKPRIQELANFCSQFQDTNQKLVDQLENIRLENLKLSNEKEDLAQKSDQQIGDLKEELMKSQEELMKSQEEIRKLKAQLGAVTTSDEKIKALEQALKKSNALKLENELENALHENRKIRNELELKELKGENPSNIETSQGTNDSKMSQSNTYNNTSNNNTSKNLFTPQGYVSKKFSNVQYTPINQPQKKEIEKNQRDNSQRDNSQGDDSKPKTWTKSTPGMSASDKDGQSAYSARNLLNRQGKSKLKVEYTQKKDPSQ